MRSVSYCPHCGGLIRLRPDPLNLTPRQRQIYDLVKKRPRTRQQLWDVLYGDRPNDGPCEKVITVLIHNLNQQLKPYEVAIRSDTRGCYAGTYYLIDLDADAIRQSA